MQRSRCSILIKQTTHPGTVKFTFCMPVFPQLLKSVRLWGTVHIFGSLQGGSNATFPVRHIIEHLTARFYAQKVL